MISKEALNEEAKTVSRALRITTAMTKHAVRHKDCQCCIDILRMAGELSQ